jgi:hypothetical protein
MDTKKQAPGKYLATIIVEKDIAPKFSRKKHATQPSYSLPPASSAKVDPKTESEFCEQLLSDGFVQSYIDFYHLTHRPDPTVSDARNSVKIVVPYNDMVYLKDALTEAEISRRRGNTMGVYSAYNKLANFYSGKMDWKTCIFFQRKYLDVAQLTADLRAEMASNHSLGLVYQQMGDFHTARLFHERHEEISLAVDVPEEAAKANAELYKVYKGIARGFDQDDGHDTKLNMYMKTLEASIKSWDKTAGKHTLQFRV